MTTLVMIVCILTASGAGCVQITEPSPSEAACEARAGVIRASLDAGADVVVIGALVRCDGPKL
jgi:hypothetical protein